ncbi:two-component system regulatory protein YycI [Allobacillus sp. GCM10007491]|uniref:Two-component system regulatory protein YycI n=1 Tax=Allobacillus saliphilus TaxID=2912308 RepID=A0A941CVN0_9BACI|nr:two-component system regulatory protein YycI [Allobacillus saliphilus]MBR7554509.1 two-component system regulatory protein YycI [Allobacillus saliphilus]
MKWGSVKTLFIIAFLILNFFLAQQLLEKIDETNLETLSQTTFEDGLAAEDITIGELPESGMEASYISAERYLLSEDDKETLEGSLANQNIAIINNQTIVSEFIDPVPVGLDDESTTVMETLAEYVIYDDVYELWKYDEDKNVLLFFQKQNDRTVLFNKAGVLYVKLNEKQEAVSYYQTLLNEVRVQGDPQTVVDPMNAIESVFNSNEVLRPEDHISDMKLAYHSLLALKGEEQEEQVFTPTWMIEINDGERYAFVNAMEGQTISTDEEVYMEEIETTLEQQLETHIRSDEEE